jgi:hypothetical protein
MSWLKKLNPFAKEETAAPAEGGLAELANDPQAKGMLGTFFRKWKDPAFVKQLRTIAVHMQREGVNIRDRAAVQAWLEKNKERIEKGELEEPLKPGETFVKTGPDVGRNDPCHCGSGKKFKKCHGA